MTELPRPTKAFAVLSGLVILGSLYILSGFLAEAIVDPSGPTAILGIPTIGVLFTVAAIQQYRSTFHGKPAAARVTSILFYVMGGVLALAFVTNVGECVIEGIGPQFWWPLAVFLLLPGILGLLWARWNARWSQQLRLAYAGSAEPLPSRTFTLRELLLGVVVVAVMAGFTKQSIQTCPPQFGEHVEAAAARVYVPESATDVSFARGYRGTISYEFNTDESSFRTWVARGIGSMEANAAGVPTREIVEPFRIERYGGIGRQLGGPKETEIVDGLYYCWRKEDRGVYAAFDRQTGRAYYHAHYH